MNHEAIFKTVQYSEQASRNLFTQELYRGLERVSEGRSTLFLLGDTVRSNNAESRERELVLTPAFFHLNSSTSPEFLIGLPQRPNEIAMFLHGNELHQFIQSRTKLPPIEIKYMTSVEMSPIIDDKFVAEAIALPLTFYPDTKNYVVLKRNNEKKPEATIFELAIAHRAWLDELYTTEQSEFPQIDVIVYDKKSNGENSNVHFRRLSQGSNSLTVHDIDGDKAKVYQTFQFSSLEPLVQ